MMSELYQAMLEGLKAIRDYPVYREDVPQGFQTPCFMITIYDQNPSRGINGRLKNSVQVDVHYFPENEVDHQEECWKIGEDLAREFQMKNFKIKNRNLKITDRVLHFLFDVDYRESRIGSEPKMQTMSQNTEMKEG